jgi:hypothetical protein
MRRLFEQARYLLGAGPHETSIYAGLSPADIPSPVCVPALACFERGEA